MKYFCFFLVKYLNVETGKPVNLPERLPKSLPRFARQTSVNSIESGKLTFQGLANHRGSTPPHSAVESHLSECCIVGELEESNEM